MELTRGLRQEFESIRRRWRESSSEVRRNAKISLGVGVVFSLGLLVTLGLTTSNKNKNREAFLQRVGQNLEERALSPFENLPLKAELPNSGREGISWKNNEGSKYQSVVQVLSPHGQITNIAIQRLEDGYQFPTLGVGSIAPLDERRKRYDLVYRVDNDGKAWSTHEATNSKGSTIQLKVCANERGLYFPDLVHGAINPFSSNKDLLKRKGFVLFYDKTDSGFDSYIVYRNSNGARVLLYAHEEDGKIIFPNLEAGAFDPLSEEYSKRVRPDYTDLNVDGKLESSPPKIDAIKVLP